jgi:hypothetical protein
MDKAQRVQPEILITGRDFLGKMSVTQWVWPCGDPAHRHPLIHVCRVLPMRRNLVETHKHPQLSHYPKVSKSRRGHCLPS